MNYNQNNSGSRLNGDFMGDLNGRKAARRNSGLPDTISYNMYNLVIGGILLYGFIANALIVWLGGDFFTSFAQNHRIIFLVGYFILALGGSLISFMSANPFVSFLGYNMVVVPVGAVLAVSLGAYSLQDILFAIITTGAVTAVMTLLGTLYPRFFAKLGRTLFISLSLGFIANFVAIIFGYAGNIFNWLFVVLFSLYIGYDWQKAQMYPKTIDNAIDSALDLYLDIINLFIRLLEILGRRNRN